jgi:HPt (histidine-containing phosphotransfer) domain-containing protein
MDRYLAKPYTIDQLFRVLESCVPGSEHTEPVKASAPVATLPARDPNAASTIAAIPVLTNRVPSAPRRPPAVAPAMTPAVLDEKTLDQIRELQRGIPDLLAKVAEMYLENSALLLKELHGSLAAKDAAGLSKAAHALKSTSFNTGAKDLAELCAALETIGLEGRIEDAKSTLERVVHEHARVALALEALKAAA